MATIVEERTNFDHISKETNGAYIVSEVCTDESTSDTSSTSPSSPPLNSELYNKDVEDNVKSKEKSNSSSNEDLNDVKFQTENSGISKDVKLDLNISILDATSHQQEFHQNSADIRKKRKLNSEELCNFLTDQEKPHSLKRCNTLSDGEPDNLIDITDLLPLPQKEAANILGISESMLCKRFKESTRRKWPYRYLRKIEKIIVQLNKLKKNGTISQQDQIRLDELLIQKKECLEPVKIRITNHDKLPLTSYTTNKSSQDDDLSESDEDEMAIEALGLLRSLSPKEIK